MDNVVLVERDSPRAGVWRVILNDPGHANALTPDLVAQLETACHAAFDADARVVIMESSSGRFCAGSDLSDVDAATERDLRARFGALEDLLETVRRAPALTIAIVRGVAFGAGADLVTSCDYRLGTGAARFAFPGNRFGLMLGTRHLATVVGRQRAREILVEGQTLDADNAVACGLLSTLCDGDRAVTDRLEAILDGAAGLDLPTLQALLRLTRDTGSERDRAELLTSTWREGLASRIGKHAERTRKERAARAARKV